MFQKHTYMYIGVPLFYLGIYVLVCTEVLCALCSSLMLGGDLYNNMDGKGIEMFALLKTYGIHKAKIGACGRMRSSEWQEVECI